MRRRNVVMDSFRRASERGPLVLGHRGASAHEPENTLRAFSRAMRDGADGVELDVHLASDDVVVVVHDADLRRVANDPRRIAETPSTVLATIDVGHGERIPTLDEALDLVLDAGGVVNVELKATSGRELALAKVVGARLRARRREQATRVVLSSFSVSTVLMAAWFAPAVTPVAFLFDEHLGAHGGALLARALPVDAVHPRHTLLSRAWVERERETLGRIVGTWTVDGADHVMTAARLGVDVVISNSPADARRHLDTAR